MLKYKSSAVISDDKKNDDYNYQTQQSKNDTSRVDINDLLKRIEDTKKVERKKLFLISLCIIFFLLLLSLFIFV